LLIGIPSGSLAIGAHATVAEEAEEISTDAHAALASLYGKVDGARRRSWGLKESLETEM
jgi:hypothetical protein